MIGYGTKLSPAVSLGLYYSMSEAEHETLAVSGGGATDAVAVPGSNDTPGMVTDFDSPNKNKLDASEVSSLGITLNLRF